MTELNWFLKQNITIIDIDFEETSDGFHAMLPLLWALYSDYMKRRVIRIDITRKGYHIMLHGNYPNLQYLFGADMRLNAKKRLYTVKRDRETGRLRRHLTYFSATDEILNLIPGRPRKRRR